MQDISLTDLETEMGKCIENLELEFSRLRTGRANPGMLDHVMVQGYDGQNVPLAHVALVSLSDARTISVQVWDKAVLADVERAIRNAGLGLSIAVDGTIVRLSMPILTQERRKELVKLAKKSAEHTQIALRKVRHDKMDEVKKIEKEKTLGKDEIKVFSEKIQRIADKYRDLAHTLLEKKEKEVMLH